MTTSWERVAIIGVGLMGGSLGLALRERHLAGTVVGIGRRMGSLRRAHELGACDEITTDVAQGVAEADLVVAACPASQVVPLLEQAVHSASPGAVLTDVASTKDHIVHTLEARLAETQVRFVGGHPLVGSEKSGVDHANSKLYEGATIVLTPTETTDPQALAEVTELWESVGSIVKTLTPEEHDAVLAQTSHLPHLVATALVNTLSPGTGEFVGPGFLDTTRVAAADPELWKDIFISNAADVVRSLARFRKQLSSLENALAADPEQLSRLLSQAREARLSLRPRNGCRSSKPEPGSQ